MKSSRSFISALVGVVCVSATLLYFLSIHGRVATASALKIKAVAHQWWWEFDYPSVGIRTSDVLYLPSGTEVQLELRSGDVIHSFWIEGMKDSVDVIPGKPRLLDVFVKSPGELYGNCDSSCGCGTVCMRFRASLEFQQWAFRARLRRSEFKAPKTGEPPACALNTNGHAHHDHPHQSFASVARWRRNNRNPPLIEFPLTAPSLRMIAPLPLRLIPSAPHSAALETTSSIGVPRRWFLPHPARPPVSHRTMPQSRRFRIRQVGRKR